ncbi:MAG: sugar phosphate nucleotidyltransferase [Bacteroidales bacterium]
MVKDEAKRGVRTVLIMAGGAGERFWPLSTKERPKQLLKLIDPQRSLLRITVDRIAPLVAKEKIFIATNKIQEKAVREEFKEFPQQNIIVEPLFRDTAAAIGYSLTQIERLFPGCSVAVLPSDHLIERERLFRSVLQSGFECAEEEGAIVTIGIAPTYPATGYGYIELEQKLESSKGCEAPLKVAGFCEKPNLTKAESFLKSGNYLWNGGIFIFRSAVMWEAYRNLLPLHYATLLKISKLGADEGERVRLLFNEFERISIDYGIMEKYNNIKVIPCHLGWSDIGSYEALSNIFKKEGSGSVSKGVALREIESKNNIVIGDGIKRVSLIGVDNLIVVESDGELLVCPRSEGEKIKLFFQ